MGLFTVADGVNCLGHSRLQLINLLAPLFKGGSVQKEVDRLNLAALSNIKVLGATEVRNARQVLTLESNDGSSAGGAELFLQQRIVKVG